MRLAVLASGTGSILHAMIDAGLHIAVVVVDRPCRAVELATEAGIEVVTVERTEWGGAFDRDAYTAEVVAALTGREVDVVAMAGYGTVLGAGVFAAYEGRILNTHPSLLPAFPGWHAVDDALAHGVKVTGCTVHIATIDVDAGPILAQRAVDVLPGDTPETLHERIKSVERDLYPATIRSFVTQLGATG